MRKRKESGQSLVEFALFLPIILIILLGVANVGLAIRAQLQLAQVAQQAAQYLVHNPGLVDPDPYLVSVTSNFTLTASGGTGGSISENTNATASKVQTDLAGLATVGAGNVTVTGNTGGPYTVIFSAASKVTGLTASTGATVVPQYGQLLDYINSLSSYPLTPLEVSLTSRPVTAGTDTVQQDTLTINYPFGVILPMIGRLSVGSLQRGTLKLGATASTIVDTHPPTATSFSTNPCVMVDTYDKDGKVKKANTNNCPDLPDTQQVGSVEVMWQRPIEESSTLPLRFNYCIERQYALKDDLYYSDSNSGFPSVNNLGCVAAKVSAHSSQGAATPDLYFVDDNPDNNHMGYSGKTPNYWISAIQQNGMTSLTLPVASRSIP